MNSSVDIIKAEEFPSAESPAPVGPSVLVAYFCFCNVCDENFLLQENLTQHMVTHERTHPVSCRKCAFRCQTSAELADHIKRTHPSSVKSRRKPRIQIDRRYRCVYCGIDSFPSYTSFHNHHHYHQLTLPEPRVILERLRGGPAAGALKIRLRRDSAESHNSDHFRVMSDVCSSPLGSDSGMETPTRYPESVGSNDEAASFSLHLPENLLTAALSVPYEPPGTPPHQQQEAVLTNGDDQQQHQQLQLDRHAGDQVQSDDALFTATTPAGIEESVGQSGDGSVASEGSRAASADGGMQDDYEFSRLFSGPTMTQQPLPPLIPVGNSMASAAMTEGECRGSVSAPPLVVSAPSFSPLAPRSVSSDPGDTSGAAAPNTSGALMDALLTDTNAEVDTVTEPASSSSEVTSEGPPLIRMAAIAANIPDERSFRQDAATPAPAHLAAQLASGAMSAALSQPMAGTPLTAAGGMMMPPQLQPRPSMPGMPPASAGMPPQLTAAANGHPRLAYPLSQTAAAAPVQAMTVPGGQIITCFVCRLPMPTVRALQEHLVSVHQSLQCSMCMFKASSVNDLRAHCAAMHNVNKLAPGGAGPVGRPPGAMHAAHPSMMQRGPAPSPGGFPPGMAAAHQQQRFAGGMNGGIRRGRPPMRMPNGGHMMTGGRMSYGARMAGAQTVAGGRGAVMQNSLQKRPVGSGGDSPAKRRPNIPIQPEKSDCQVISVQRRQQGVPRIQNVEGNAAYPGGSSAAAGGSLRLGDGMSVTVQRTSQPSGSSSGQQADVASVLANRGISVTPASGGNAAAGGPQQLAVSLPNLPAGISLTPAAVASPGEGRGFAVPRPPGGSPIRQTAAGRPTRPPTVDLTVDNPARPASLACRFCSRQFTTNSALLQHEKSHGPASQQPLRCRVCGVMMQTALLMQQHMLQRHPNVQPPAEAAAPAVPSGRAPDLVVPVFDLAMVSREQLEELGVRGFLPVSQVNQRQGQLGLPIMSLDGVGRSGPSPRPCGFFNMGPVRYLR